MAIVQEHFDVNGRDFIRTYSDAGRFVVGGEPHGEYTEATDPADAGRTYVEGDRLPDDMIATQYKEILDILLGGETE